MMKIVYYIPSVLFAAFYGWLTVYMGFSGFSPIVFVWIALLFSSAVLLSKDIFWGGAFGMLTGIHWIYISTIDTGQIINIELPLGLIILVFHILCSGYVFYKSKAKKSLQQT